MPIQRLRASMIDNGLWRLIMKVRRFARRLPVLLAVAVAALWFAPSAMARVHVGVGISVPGVTVGSCWNCGYWGSGVVYYPPAPVYYAPRPVYYPAPVYYAPRPVYYYGYAPRVRYDRGHYRGYHHRGGGHGRGHYYHRGHR